MLLSRVEIKDYNVMIDVWNLFDQPAKNDIRTHGIKKLLQGDDYTTGGLLDYPYLFKNYIFLCNRSE